MTNVKELRRVENAGPDKLNPLAVSSPVPATSGNPTLRQTTLSRETRGQHDALLVAIHRLEAALAAAAPGREQSWGAVRKQAADLLRALRNHQAQEADLIFETFYTDIGAGD